MLLRLPFLPSFLQPKPLVVEEAQAEWVGVFSNSEGYHPRMLLGG